MDNSSNESIHESDYILTDMEQKMIELGLLTLDEIIKFK